MVLAQNDKNVYLASRNIQKTKIVDAASINTYDILNANNVIIAESSLKEIEKIHSVN
jgi:large subunit ribosomal protein L4